MNSHVHPQTHREIQKNYYNFQVHAVRCFKLYKIETEVSKYNKMLTSSHYPTGTFPKPSVNSYHTRTTTNLSCATAMHNGPPPLGAENACWN